MDLTDWLDPYADYDYAHSLAFLATHQPSSPAIEGDDG